LSPKLRVGQCVHAWCGVADSVEELGDLAAVSDNLLDLIAVFGRAIVKCCG
jgi:hypothetical protein